MADPTKLSDEELMNIAGQNNQQDLSSVSDEELNSIANQPIGFKNIGMPSGAEVAGMALVGGGLLAKKLTTPSTIPGPLARFGAFAAGIPGEDLEKGAEIGYRNFLQKKYYNSKIPEKVASTIESNIDELRNAAKMEFDIIAEPLKDTPIRRKFEILRGKTNSEAKNLKKNPFTGPTKDLDTSIVKGIMNADVNTMGDLLELRRNLDETIYPAKTQGVKSQFGKQVRDQINAILHENPILKSADEQWTDLSNILRENKKILGDTGENFLKRWASLTSKQKEGLAILEKKLGKEPFVSEITNWSLAQKFRAKPGWSGPIGTPLKALRPVLRGALRTGGAIGSIGKRLSGTPLSISAMALDALKFKDDPEAYSIAQETGQDYWIIKQNLAPKGSQERKIQLGQIL